MANFLDIEPVLPFKFVPNTSTPGIHFDDSWACEQIKSWEKKAYYQQKWIRSKTTKLQIRTTINPQDLKIYNSNKQVVKSIAWTITDLLIYKIAECEFDLSDTPEGIYWAYIQVTGGPIDWQSISEPIHSKDVWPDVISINYKNSFNAQGVTFTTGVDFTFCIEAAIMEMTPEAERAAYVDQTRSIFNLYGTPYRSYKLNVGKAVGVAPYMLDILNRIFCLDTVSIEGKKYQRNDGAKLEVNRVKGYPLIGGNLEIVEAINAGGVHYNDGTGPINGIVTIYDIETNFFGTGTPGVHINDVTAA